MTLTIRQRLMGLTTLVMIFLVGQGAFSAYQLMEANDTIKGIVTSDMHSLDLLGDVKFGFVRYRLLGTRAAITKDADQLKELQGKMGKQLDELSGKFKEYDEMIDTPEETALFKTFKDSYDAYAKEQVAFVKRGMDGDTEGALQDMNVTSQKDYNATLKALDALVDFTSKGSEETYAASMKDYKESMMLLGGMVLVSCVLAGWVAVTVTMGIGNGMKELIRAFTALSRLDLTVRGKAKNEDEIGMTLKQFNTTAVELTGVVKSTQDASQTVSAAAHELSAGMESITAITGQQEGALTEIAASLEETSVSAAEVNNKAMRSGQATQEIVNAINGVMDNVGHLTKSANAIGGVLEVIRGISEQINLLSLNAAIEAARAGDAGRGFAVVADEVRKLAASTNKSTDEVNQVVEELQGHVQNTKSALDTVGGALEEVRSNSESMVTAVGQQTIAVNTISKSIGEFKDQMLSVMRNVQEANEASLSLSTSAEALNQQTSRFQL